MVTGHEDPGVDYWTVEHPNCYCYECVEKDNGIKGYRYNCKWDNTHYNSRCLPVGFRDGGENESNNEEWINKDFVNTSGQNRNDLHIELVGGIKNKIAEVDSADQLKHVEIAATSEKTLISWEIDPNDANDGPVEPNDSASRCLRIIWGDEVPNKRFKRDPYWTQNGQEMEKVAGCASPVYTWFHDQVVIRGHNTADPNDPPLSVDEFSYAFVTQPRDLADLTWNNPSIPWVSLPWYATIPPAGSADLGAIALPHRPIAFLIVQFAVNFSGDPPHYKGHIIAQSHCPFTFWPPWNGAHVPPDERPASLYLGLPRYPLFEAEDDLFTVHGPFDLPPAP